MATRAPATTVNVMMAMQTSILHKLVTVELVNGLRITGRVVRFDADNMNMQLDSLSATGLLLVRREPASSGAEPTAEIYDNPPQLPPMHSLAIRGNRVKWLDIVQEQDGAGVVVSSIQLVRAGGLADSNGEES